MRGTANDRGVMARVVGSVWSPIVVVLVPFVVAAIRVATRTWYPVLDLAMTEFRVRDVGGADTPLIGLPGRIGIFPDQGSHPGPLGYYLLAPVYRLFGSSAVGLLVGAAVIGAVAAVATVLVIRRMGGIRLQWAIVVVLLVVVQTYGFDFVTQPWNPYLPLLVWFATLVAVWAVIVGDSGVLWVATLAGSLCAQTHLPYLGLAGTVVIGATVVVAWRWWHAENGSGERARAGRGLAIGVGVGVVCWIPVVLDQLFGSQNMSAIVDYFRDPPEAAIGERAGLELLLRHLDITRFSELAGSGTDIFEVAATQAQRSLIPGVVLLIAWAIAALLAVLVVRDRRLVVLHALLAVCVVLGAFSMARIFGKVWYYLTLWAWSITALILAAVVWTAVEVIARRLGDRRRLDQGVSGALVVVGVVIWSTLVAQAGTVVVPEEHLSRPLGAVVDPTVEALEASVAGAAGRDGTYTVVWNDAASFGSQGFGLVSELERRGFDAGTPGLWRVPITEQRVVDIEDADVVVLFATGAYLDQWRDQPLAIEVATVEPRSATQRREFDQLRTELLDGLAALPIDTVRRDALVEAVDFNLFSVQTDPAVPIELQRTVDRMLKLGQETAVFLIPAAQWDVAAA